VDSVKKYIHIMDKEKKIVYICSPYRADTLDQTHEHIKYAKMLSRKYVYAGYAVITPHLYYTNFLEDDNRFDREVGLKSAKGLIRVCDFMVVGNSLGISEGMKGEIEEAKRLGIDISYETQND